MELTYTIAGEYFLPNLTPRDSPNAPPLGRYGRQHKRYLKEYRPILYNQLLLTERLYPLCREIDEAAKSRLTLGMGESDILREIVYN
ncbi:hypothetical protein FACS1894188_11130 [Clostridia bacterium]|nr:hypothetical protein FACS1894188_11130 [Clostridia bacterium]